MNRHLITSIHQAGGGRRELYARTRDAALAARAQIHADPAMIECVDVAEYVDVGRDGTRERYVLDGTEVHSRVAAEQPSRSIAHATSPPVPHTYLTRGHDRP